MTLEGNTSFNNTTRGNTFEKPGNVDKKIHDRPLRSVDVIECYCCVDHRFVHWKLYQKQKVMRKKPMDTKTNSCLVQPCGQENSKEVMIMDETKKYENQDKIYEEDSSTNKVRKQKEKPNKKEIKIRIINNRIHIRREHLQSQLDEALRHNRLLDTKINDSDKHGNRRNVFKVHRPEELNKYVSIKYDKDNLGPENVLTSNSYCSNKNDINRIENGIFYRKTSTPRQQEDNEVEEAGPVSELSVTSSVNVLENSIGNVYPNLSQRIAAEHIHDSRFKFRDTDQNRKRDISPQTTKIRKRKSKKHSKARSRSFKVSKNQKEQLTPKHIEGIHSPGLNLQSDGEDDAFLVLQLVQKEIKKQFQREEEAKCRGQKQSSHDQGRRNELKKESGSNKDYTLTQSHQVESHIRKRHKKKTKQEVNCDDKVEDKTGNCKKKVSIFELHATNDSHTDSEIKGDTNDGNNRHRQKGQKPADLNDYDPIPTTVDIQDIGVDMNPSNHKSKRNKTDHKKYDTISPTVDIHEIGVDVTPSHHESNQNNLIVVPSKRDLNKPVKVGGGWNSLYDYFQRHVPVRRFEYDRSQQSDHPFLSFKSHYRLPQKITQELKNNKPKKMKAHLRVENL